MNNRTKIRAIKDLHYSRNLKMLLDSTRNSPNSLDYVPKLNLATISYGMWLVNLILCLSDFFYPTWDFALGIIII